MIADTSHRLRGLKAGVIYVINDLIASNDRAGKWHRQ